LTDAAEAEPAAAALKVRGTGFALLLDADQAAGAIVVGEALKTERTGRTLRPLKTRRAVGHPGSAGALVVAGLPGDLLGLRLLDLIGAAVCCVRVRAFADLDLFRVVLLGARLLGEEAYPSERGEATRRQPTQGLHSGEAPRREPLDERIEGGRVHNRNLPGRVRAAVKAGRPVGAQSPSRS
jgi:hypothetical protein